MAAGKAGLPLASLVGVVYFSVCGGTYGIEGAVSEGGPLAAVALVFAIPFLWAIPIALIVGELAAMMPREGGYYAWAQAGLGDFWASQTGWWALCAGVVDMALYPVLFVHYLASLAPALRLDDPLWAWLAAVLFIAAALGLNLLGVRKVGRNAVIGTVFVLAPLLVCSLAVFWQHGVELPALAPGSLSPGAMAGALSVVMWNYMGWDNASTYAGEVENPQRSYPRALGIVVVLALITYLVPLLAGLTLFPERAAWGNGAIWELLADSSGGLLLALTVVAAGALAQWGLFNSGLLYASRLPFVMARDGWLPRGFARSGRNDVPAPALMMLSLIAALLAIWTFDKLVVIDVLLYSAVIGVEVSVFVKLRLREPGRPRAFTVPGGWPGVIAVTLAPAACWGALLWTTFSDPAAFPAAALQGAVLAAVFVAGVAIYFLRQQRARERA